jgi:hypothetical protein
MTVKMLVGNGCSSAANVARVARTLLGLKPSPEQIYLDKI